MMNARRLFVVVLPMLLLTAPDLVRAQVRGAPGLAPGSRVRVSLADGERILGAVAYQSTDSLYLLQACTECQARPFAWSIISAVELSRGTRHSEGSALRGAAVGGVLVYAASRALLPTSDADGDLGMWREVAIGGLALVGAGVGALIGLGSRGEQWESVRITGSPD